MTGEQRHTVTASGSPDPAAAENDAPQLRALLPPITLKMILRALLGVLLFFCGIVLGALRMLRFRRHARGATH